MAVVYSSVCVRGQLCVTSSKYTRTSLVQAPWYRRVLITQNRAYPCIQMFNAYHVAAVYDPANKRPSGVVCISVHMPALSTIVEPL